MGGKSPVAPCTLTFSLSDDIERAVDDVVQAKVGVLLLFPLRVRVGAQKQRLVLKEFLWHAWTGVGVRAIEACLLL